MADNYIITEGSGRTMAADDIGTILFPRIKLVHGADGVNAGDVADANPLPIKITDGTNIASVRNTGSSDSLNVAIVDASGNQITSFGGSNTEDAALGASPIGTLAMARRDDALSTLTPVEDDAVGLRVNSRGALWVIHDGTMTVSGTVTANAGTGTFTTSDTATLVDDAAFTPATSRVMMMGAQLDNTSPDSVDEGDAGALRMSANRNLFINIRDGGGAERAATVMDTGSNDSLAVAIVDASGNQITSFGGGTQYAEDVAFGGVGTGTLMIARRDDSLSTLTPAEDDAVGLRTNNRGALWVIHDGTMTVTGTVTANAGTGNFNAISANKQGSSTVAMSSTANEYQQGVTGYSTCVAQITGTWTGTLVAEGSADSGTTYVALPMISQATGVQSSNTTANGNFFIPIAGLTNVRIRCSVTGTGTANVTLNEISGGGFANVAGVVQSRNQDGSGNNITSRSVGAARAFDIAIVDGSGNQITSFGGGTQYAEDAAFGGNGTGTLMIARRDDALSTLTPVEDDAVGLRANSRGALWVVHDGTIATSDTATLVDDAAFTPATGRVMMIGATRDDTTPDTVDEGDGGAVRMTSDRALHVCIRDAAGNNRGLNIDSSNRLAVTVGSMASLVAGTAMIGSVGGPEAHDAAAAQNPLQIGARAQNSDPTEVSADGDICRIWLDRRGALQTQNVPGTARGCTSARLISAATTNATSVKASAGQLYGYALFNNGSAPAYVKFYNKASSPTVGTDVPVMTLMIPAEGGLNLDSATGIAFGTGLAYAITNGMADSDTTAVAAAQVSLNIWYK